MKIKVFKLNDRMFEEEIFIVVGDQTLADNWIKKRYKISAFGEKSFIDGCFATYENKLRNERHRIIWVRRFDWSVRTMGLLSHELLHCVHAVLKDIGFKFSDESEEIYTTYLQRLSTDAFWKMRNLRMK